nr:unnamed protein product [Callosobruchus analis]
MNKSQIIFDVPTLK